MTVFTALPLWALFVTTVAIAQFAVEAGFRFGRYRAGLETRETEKSIGTMVGATLGLLAFMLAFTFGSAASRFGVRKQLVIEDASAIKTTYSRAELLPTPHADEVQKLLKEYVDLRVAGRPANVEVMLARSKEIQDQIWERTVALAHQYPDHWTVELFSDSMNHLIDRHNTRVITALHRPLPRAIVVSLNILLLLAMGAVGYQSGLTSERRTVASAILVIAFSVIMCLIAELDAIQGRVLRVSQKAMIEVQKDIHQQSP